MFQDQKEIYKAIKADIENRFQDFSGVWKKGSDEDIFCEFIFCLLTPQAKAEHAWKTVEILRGKDLLLKGGVNKVAKELNLVRFKNTKANNLMEARAAFMKAGKFLVREIMNSLTNVFAKREWLVSNVKGMGMKEASHFLRNIGFGEKIAILDRHILRNLVLCGVIDKIPDSISVKNYIAIEEKMREFADKIKIPLAHLDMVFWYKVNGKLFK